MAHERSPLRLVPEPVPGPEVRAVPRTLGAVELLPGRIRAALLDRSGAVLDRTEAEFDASSPSPAGPDEALARVAAVFEGHRPSGIGVAAAGVIDPAGAG